MMNYSSQVDAMVAIALEDYCPQNYVPRKRPHPESQLGVKQFQKEFPTPESQWAYVESFLSRLPDTIRISTKEEAQVIAALGFWFDIIWPNLPKIRNHRAYLDFIHSSVQPRFETGTIVAHSLFGYRGVIVDVDSMFMETEAWYDQMARSRPPKNRPWYHVLVDQTEHVTYVAERHLMEDKALDPIEHPLLEQYFSDFDGDKYWENPEI